MKEKLVIIGTGSLSGEVVDFVKRYDLYDIVGFSVDKKYIKNETHLGYPVYPLEELDSYIDKEQVKLFVSISWYQNMNRVKRAKYEELKAAGYHFANLISPTATVFAHEMGEGNWIYDGCYIAFNSRIGNNNTFCHQTYLSHFSDVGDHNVFSARSNVAGSTTIGDQNYVGIGAIVFNKIIVGNKCVIGGGAIVKRNLPDFSLVVAADSIVKQKDTDSIEKYISLDHIKKTIGDEKIKK